MSLKINIVSCDKKKANLGDCSNIPPSFIQYLGENIPQILSGKTPNCTITVSIYSANTKVTHLNCPN
ncbi:hypothetical protein I79_012711 [Cricetulus griseus]|uniref:Uncharacterized protein n=1 Tax=Cricetulus griseus TaxID=10029 RepID=G3HPJ7_CRIGR|nr:hypothetical protein I79_012711 [Cricetulus griseus]